MEARDRSVRRRATCSGVRLPGTVSHRVIGGADVEALRDEGQTAKNACAGLQNPPLGGSLTENPYFCEFAFACASTINRPPYIHQPILVMFNSNLDDSNNNFDEATERDQARTDTNMRSEGFLEASCDKIGHRMRRTGQDES